MFFALGCLDRPRRRRRKNGKKLTMPREVGRYWGDVVAVAVAIAIAVAVGNVMGRSGCDCDDGRGV
jgi:hypothetical protein